MEVGQDISLGNGDNGHGFVELFIVTNGKLKVSDNIILVKFKNDQDIIQIIKLW